VPAQQVHASSANLKYPESSVWSNLVQRDRRKTYKAKSKVLQTC